MILTDIATRLVESRERGIKKIFGNQLTGPTDPATDAYGEADARQGEHLPPRKGFFTDTSICIGCKACEVACKEWNKVPPREEHPLTATSYDNSAHLGADTWRHVAFIEADADAQARAKASGKRLLELTPVAHLDAAGLAPEASGCGGGCGPSGCGSSTTGQGDLDDELPPVRWLMSSDVCKHCTHAGCLDVCPTGALFRSEFGTVVVQEDVCNGCGYCVAACPFGVIGRRRTGTVTIGSDTSPIHNGGIAQKCTLCYDRISHDMQPACAKTCPTTSITFGDHDDMVAKARERLAELHAQGRTEARLYGANPDDGVGGTGSVFLLLDEPEAYGLPPDPVVTTRDLPAMFMHAGIAGTMMIAVIGAVFGVNGRMR